MPSQSRRSRRARADESTASRSAVVSAATTPPAIIPSGRDAEIDLQGSSRYRRRARKMRHARAKAAWRSRRSDFEATPMKETAARGCEPIFTTRGSARRMTTSTPSESTPNCGTPISAPANVKEKHHEDDASTRSLTPTNSKYRETPPPPSSGWRRARRQHCRTRRTATNAMSTKTCPNYRMSSDPAAPASASAMPSATQNTRSGLMPISIATSGFCAAARIALPKARRHERAGQHHREQRRRSCRHRT